MNIMKGEFGEFHYGHDISKQDADRKDYKSPENSVSSNKMRKGDNADKDGKRG